MQSKMSLPTLTLGLLCTLVLNACSESEPTVVETEPSHQDEAPLATEHTDPRAFQHGIDYVPTSNGQQLLIWSSAGIRPMGPDINGNWTHDVYFSTVKPQANSAIISAPTRFITAPEAQEPASAAITTIGTIMVTMEDGWNSKNVLSQRYGVYNEQMEPISAYPQSAMDGGHSGHVAAVDNLFAIFYSEGWIEGGGQDNLGSGNNIHLSIFNAHGDFITRRDDVTNSTDTRDWWPLIAGSKERALLIWQRFQNSEDYAQLRYAIYHPKSNQWVLRDSELSAATSYYQYDVQYLPQIDRFLVLTNTPDNRGKGILISQQGEIIKTTEDLPPIVREAQPAIRKNGNGITIAYPASPSGIAVVNVSRDAIAFSHRVDFDAIWGTSGTDGFFLNDQRVLFSSLSRQGVNHHQVQLD